MTRSVVNKCFPKRKLCIVTAIALCLVLHVRITKYVRSLLSKVITTFQTKKTHTTLLSNYKYVLSWSNYHLLFKDGKNKFKDLKCPIKRCIFTEDKDLLGEYSNFNAIIFNYKILNSKERPLKRSPSQIYIFISEESSYNVPACEVYNDGFFNWTLTYRLDSDVVWYYFLVRNHMGAIVAPSHSVKWKSSLRPVQKKIRTILAGKTKAAAWLVSHCRADSLRDEYLTRLQEHLFHFSLKIDVYGSCSNTKCPNNKCEEMLQKHYYFYMAFENSFAEDYVTEKVLHGYDNYAVPIVYGGANYKRFLPSGSYINAREMHPYNLALAMYQAIQTPAVYETYFKWTNLYTVDGNMKSHHPLCKLCATLHREKEHIAAKDNFRLWWNGLNGMKWCLSKEYWNETAILNVDAKHVFNLY